MGFGVWDLALRVLELGIKPAVSGLGHAVVLGFGVPYFKTFFLKETLMK